METDAEGPENKGKYFVGLVGHGLEFGRYTFKFLVWTDRFEQAMHVARVTRTARSEGDLSIFVEDKVRHKDCDTAE